MFFRWWSSRYTGLTCPICGCTRFADYRARKNAQCSRCGSLERTRALWLAFKTLDLGSVKGKVMHFAPELSIAKQLARIEGIEYQPRDFDPSHFHFYPKKVKAFNLCTDAATLAPESIAGVIHSHVFEHLPCDVYKTFEELNRAIRPGGYHLFIVPFFSKLYSEDLSPETTDEERTRKFGQFDHVRTFGTDDFERRFFGAFEGFERVKLTDLITPDDLRRAAVPGGALTRKTGHYVICFRKKASQSSAAA